MPYIPKVDRAKFDFGLLTFTISDVVKALECAKLELYARVARLYETEKAEINGDVYANPR